MCSSVGDDLPSVQQDLGSTSSTTYIGKSTQGGPVLTSALCRVSALSIQRQSAILLMRKQILRDTKKLSSFSLVLESGGAGDCLVSGASGTSVRAPASSFQTCGESWG